MVCRCPGWDSGADAGRLAIDGGRIHEQEHDQARPAPEGRRPVRPADSPLPGGNAAVARLLGAETGIGIGGGAVPDGVADAIDGERGGGSPLPGEVLSDMGAAFGGTDFSGVRVHTGDRAATLNQQVSARAFTTGGDIFLSGALDTASTSRDWRSSCATTGPAPTAST